MQKTPLVEEALSNSAIGAFFEVYNTLGYGFLEHLYVLALERELRARGHTVARQVAVRVMYKGEELGLGRIDLLVDGKLVIEAKATERLREGASRQLFNYLHATNLTLGLLLHFGPVAKFYPVIHHHTPRRNDGFQEFT